MNKKINKFIAWTLILTITMNYLPEIPVLANFQNPVNDLTITDLSLVNSNTYSYSLLWRHPAISQELSGGGAVNETIEEPDFYEISSRNATKSEGYKVETTTIPYDPNTPNVTKTYKDNPLEPGSLYMYKVVPVHTHMYETIAPDGTISYSEARAPLSDPNGEGQEAIYMTDIEVTAEANGSGMTVTWDNPTIDGRDVFTSYKIYYEEGGSEVVSIDPTSPSIEVSMTDPNLVRNKDGTLEYTFYDPTLQIGSFYAVKVEPMYNGQPARELKEINVGGSNYSFAYTSMDREYRYDGAYVKPALYIEQQGTDYVRLYWDSLATSILNVDKVEIYSSLSEDFLNPQKIGTLSGSSARNINYWVTESPDRVTYYKIIIYFKDDAGLPYTMESNIVMYDPTYNDFIPYKPNITQITDNGLNPLELTVEWEAFMHDPYNTNELENIDPVYKKYLDRDVNYTVWITDDVSNFNDPYFEQYPVETLDAATLETVDGVDVEGNKQLNYTSSFTEYATDDGEGGYVYKPIEENKIYYVAIVATRDPSGQISEACLGTHYIPPTGDINLIPKDMAAPPLRIKKDENEVDMITESSITIQWDTRWVEAFNPEDKTWYTQISIDQNGNIVYGEQLDNVDDLIYLNNPEFNDGLTPEQSYQVVKEYLIEQGASDQAVNQLALRVTDLKNASYEIHVVPYDYMNENGGYDVYVDNLQINDSAWTPINGEGDPLHPEYTVTNQNAPTNSALEPNTSYVVFFRPYVVDDTGKKNSYNPNYITATTLDKREELEIVPTVPIIVPVSETDTSITFKWEYTEGLKYTIKYSSLVGDYSSGGTEITNDEIVENGELKVESDGKTYMYYTIDNLFPDTNYYIWMNAESTQETSAWSNYITMKTDEIEKPKPPKGFGLGSKDDLDIYNSENGTELEPIGEDYITIEWTRDSKDTEETTFGGEVEGGEYLFSENYPGTYVIRFTGLDPNTTYYFRAKTVLTITKDSSGNVVTHYNYVVQMSKTKDFKDFVEITAPPLEDISGLPESDVIRVESDWTEVLAFRTGTSQGEYDGDKNPDQYPLPSDDFDITYDPSTETVYYRFRTNEIDSDGNQDNNVDQRFISKLVSSNTFVYELDMTSYNGMPVKNSVVEFPYSIIQAFEKEGITLKLKSNNTVMTIPPGSFNTPEVQNLPDYGIGSTVTISFKDSTATSEPLTSNSVYVSNPETIEVKVTTPSTTVKLDTLNEDVTIDMKVNAGYNISNRNVALYEKDENNEWVYVSSEYNEVDRVMTTETNNVGTYAVIAKTTPTNQYPEVFNQLEITDMTEYNPNDEISALQFNNIVLAVAKGEPQVAMNAPLSEEDYNSLGKSKLLVSGTMVSREAGISSLVRLYEIQTKSTIKTNTDISSSMYKDISSASTEYQQAILKGEYLGFYRGDTLNPKANMTFDEFFYMLNIVMSDASI